MTGCWLYAKVRPRWCWTWRRLHLFLGVVWRRVDSAVPDRLDWRTAWDISKSAVGLIGPMKVHRAPHP
jgi:hypothetical protein